MSKGLFGSTPEQPKQLHSTNSEIFFYQTLELQLPQIRKKMEQGGAIHLFCGVPQGVLQKLMFQTSLQSWWIITHQ
jgi:hypothetical protein